MVTRAKRIKYKRGSLCPIYAARSTVRVAFATPRCAHAAVRHWYGRHRACASCTQGLTCQLPVGRCARGKYGNAMQLIIIPGSPSQCASRSGALQRGYLDVACTGVGAQIIKQTRPSGIIMDEASSAPPRRSPHQPFRGCSAQAVRVPVARRVGRPPAGLPQRRVH